PFAETPVSIWDSLTPGNPEADRIARFLNQIYGWSSDDLTALVNQYVKGSERKDVTSEYVQHIKELIARVGKLEFLILANNVDDAKEADNGIHAADLELIKQNDQGKLDDYAKQGNPPPTPSRIFKITTAKGQTSYVSYRWVEIGPKYRQQLHLLNREAGRSQN